MVKAEIKTKQNEASVDAFLNGVADEQQRSDSRVILDMMKRLTGERPKMWGTSIIGFGMITVKSPATGREVDWIRVGFSPRKANISLYVLNGSPKQATLLEKLGKHTTGKGCLYIKRLTDVDEKVLEKLVKESLKPIRIPQREG